MGSKKRPSPFNQTAYSGYLMHGGILCTALSETEKNPVCGFSAPCVHFQTTAMSLTSGG